eukprot:2631492-Pleurochrysis_carterae.AAC.1
MTEILRITLHVIRGTSGGRRNRAQDRFHKLAINASELFGINHEMIALVSSERADSSSGRGSNGCPSVARAADAGPGAGGNKNEGATGEGASSE